MLPRNKSISNLYIHININIQIFLQDNIWILVYSSCNSYEFLIAKVSKESLFWIGISISKDTAEINLSFIFVILASNENENSWLSKCIPFLVLILLSLEWWFIAFFCCLSIRNLKNNIQSEPILKYSEVFCRFYSYLMDCSFASHFFY